MKSLKQNLIHRRKVLMATGLGAGSIALHSLFADESGLKPHHQPRAQSVIFLFMSGGPSQVDTFDPKPDLNRLAGSDVPDSLAANVPRIKRAGLKNLMASPWCFARHGGSGLEVSELFPEVSKQIDELCVIRSMTHRNPVHGPGECVALTGSSNGSRPSLGAWTLYGLGSGNDQLPAYVAMNLHTDGMQFPQVAGWGNGFLPTKLQGTVVDPLKGIQHVKMPLSTNNVKRKDELNLLRRMEQKYIQEMGQSTALEARMESYRVAFEMQTAAPELFDLKRENEKTKQLYGMNRVESQAVGRACILARRMVERGVRFIQIRVGGWDAHGNLKGNHEKMAKRTDMPIAALLGDLKQRGLLDSTLVVWGGEFGRTPTMEGLANGRDHSPAAYTVWLAGGGVSGGQIIGETDPIGYTVLSNPVKPQDLHATILHALGLDSKQLVFDHHGLKESPLGVNGGAPVLKVFQS